MPSKDPAKKAKHKRDYYERHKAAVLARSRIHRKKSRVRLQQVVREAKNVPCADCGGRYPPWVMDFDHLLEKDFGINQMVASLVSERRLRTEIAKCEVVCANCHRDRTHCRAMERSGIEPDPVPARGIEVT